MKYIRVCRTDFSRWFATKKFFLAIAGIFTLHYLLLLQSVDELETANIVYIVFMHMEDPFVIINFIFASAVFGTSYCEEKRKNYFSFYIKRCDKISYICSKITHSFLSAFSVITIAMMLWIISLRLIMPWADFNSDMFWVCVDQGLGSLLEKHKFLTYYLIYSMGIGMLAGIISVITFVISLFIKDQMVVHTLPAIIFYIYNVYIGDFSEHIYYWSLEHIFYFPKSQIPSVGLTFLRGALYATLLSVMFGIIAYHKFRRELYE